MRSTATNTVYDTRLRRSLTTHFKRPLSQRAYAAPPSAYIWSRAYQAAAVKRGWFLERVQPFNHVHVVSLATGAEQDAMDAIECAAFLGDSLAHTALAFIEQQDEHGYSGAWGDHMIEVFTEALRWLKDDTRRARQATANMSERMRRVARHRWKT